VREERDKPPESLYLAELFIVEQERGLGLGELLLTGTLHARNCALRRVPRDCVVSSSHLFVSSQNVSAVNCYLKLGYDRATRPSGDAAHDLVMEMRDCQDKFMRSLERLSQQLIMGSIGSCRRRRKPTVGRSSSGSTIRTSPSPHAVKPRASKATCCDEAEENFSTRRSWRHASEQDNFELGTTPIVLAEVNVRKRRIQAFANNNTHDERCVKVRMGEIEAATLLESDVVEKLSVLSSLCRSPTPEMASNLRRTYISSPTPEMPD
jgi:hypothetical protein